MRRFMAELGDLSGLDIAVARPRPAATRSANLRPAMDRGGRPVLHGSALLRVLGLGAGSNDRCRAVDPGAGALFRGAALGRCARRAGA